MLPSCCRICSSNRFLNLVSYHQFAKVRNVWSSEKLNMYWQMGVGASLAFWPLLRLVPLPVRSWSSFHNFYGSILFRVYIHRAHNMLLLRCTIDALICLAAKPGHKWLIRIHVIEHHQWQSICRKARELYFTFFLFVFNRLHHMLPRTVSIY